MDKKYHAFISYRHADNKEQGRQWATWLHQAIETYEVPSELVGQKNPRGEVIPSRIYPVFRDEQELPAHADLGSSIVGALKQTGVLVVLCSPRAVASTYVADEIDYFKKLGHSERIIAAMIDGEPNTSWDKSKHDLGFCADDECFPKPLQFEYDADGNPTNKHAEPIAADFRINNGGVPEQGWTTPAAYRQYLKETKQLNNAEIEKRVSEYQQQQHLMLLKIIAGILGVPLGELTQRDKEYQLEQARLRAKRLKMWLAVVAVFAIVAVGAGLFAFQQKTVAVKSQNVAMQERERAEQQLVEANHNLGLVFSEKAVAALAKGENNHASSYAGYALEKLNPQALEKTKVVRDIVTKTPLIPVLFQSNDTAIDRSGPLEGRYLANGKTFLSVLKKTLIFWDVASGRKIKEYPVESDAVALSPSGKYIAVGTTGKQVVLLDSSTLNEVKKFERLEAEITDVQISANDDVIAVGDMSGYITFLSIDGTDENVVIPVTQYAVSSLSFSPDGKKLAAGTTARDDKLTVWDVATGKAVQELYVQEKGVRDVLYSRDGKSITAVSEGNVVRIWNLATGDIIHESHSGEGSFVLAAYSPDGKTIARVTKDGGIVLWNLESRSQRGTIGFQKGWNDICFSPDGKKLAATSYIDNKVYFFDVQTGELLNKKNGHSTALQQTFFSSDGRTLISNADDSLIIWNVLTGKTEKVFEKNDQSYYSALSPDGQTVVLGNLKGKIYSIDLMTGDKRDLLTHNSLQIMQIVFSPDGKKIAYSTYGGGVSLMDPETGDELVSNILSGSYSLLAFSPDGKKLLATGSDKSVRLVEVSTGKEVKSFGSGFYVSSLAFSHNGKYIALGKYDGTASVWDVASGERKYVLDGHVKFQGRYAGLSQVNSVTFSKTDALLATGSSDKQIILWNMVNGEKVAVLQGHSSSIGALSFSPDGETLVSGSSDHSVIFWDISALQKMKAVKNVDPYSDDVLTFTSDGELVTLTEESRWSRGNKKSASNVDERHFNSVAVSPLGSFLAYREDSGRTVIKNRVTGKNIVFNGGDNNYFSVYTQLHFSSQERYLAIETKEKQDSYYYVKIVIWDSVLNKFTTLSVRKDRAKDFMFSSNEKLFAVKYDDQSIQVWETETWQKVKTISDANTHSGVAFSHDSSSFTYISKKKEITILDVETWKPTTRIESQPDHARVLDFVFTPDDTKILGVLTDGSTGEWLLQTGKMLRYTERDDSEIWVNKAFFSSDQKYILLVFNKFLETMLLDGVTGEEITSFKDHSDWIGGVAFSPDGSQVATRASDGKVVVRDLDLLMGNFSLTSKDIEQLTRSRLNVLQVDSLKTAPTLYQNSDSSHVSWQKRHPLFWLTTAEQGNVDAMWELGQIYLKNGQKTEAKRWLQSAVEQGHLAAKEQLLPLLDLDNSEKSREYIRRRAESGDVKSLLALGDYYLKKSDLSKAAVLYMQAQEHGYIGGAIRIRWVLDSALENIKQFLTESYELQKKKAFAAARKELKKARQLEYDLQDIIKKDKKILTQIILISNRIGTVYSRKGMYDQAVESYEHGVKLSKEIVQLAPADEIAKQLLSNSYIKLGNTYQKTNMLDKALENYLGDHKHCLAWFESGRSDRLAQKHLARSYFALYELEQKRGNEEEAENYLFKIYEQFVKLYTDGILHKDNAAYFERVKSMTEALHWKKAQIELLNSAQEELGQTDKALVEDPENKELQMKVAGLHLQVAKYAPVLDDQNKTAFQHIDEAVLHFTENSKGREPDDRIVQSLIEGVELWVSLGGDLDQALIYIGMPIEMSVPVLRENSGDRKVWRKLIMRAIRVKLNIKQMITHRETMKSLEELQKRLETNPDDIGLKVSIASHYVKLADNVKRSSKEEKEQYAQKALHVLEPLKESLSLNMEGDRVYRQALKMAGYRGSRQALKKTGTTSGIPAWLKGSFAEEKE